MNLRLTDNLYKTTCLVSGRIKTSTAVLTYGYSAVLPHSDSTTQRPKGTTIKSSAIKAPLGLGRTYKNWGGELCLLEVTRIKAVWSPS